MKSRPILFSGPMVRAILNGTKTRTRRVVKPQGATMFPMLEPGGIPRGDWFISYPKFERVGNSGHKCPYGQPGDQLWVKETLRRYGNATVQYVADEKLGIDPFPWPWNRDVVSSLHCPRLASRITLEITAVRAERLNEISIADCHAEGIPATGPEHCLKLPRNEYRTLWESINGPGSWDLNPWVWIIEFRRVWK